MIKKIAHDKSEQLRHELNSIEKLVSSFPYEDIESVYPTPEVYYRDYMKSTSGVEFKRHADSICRPLRLLDIGAGRGETSIYLASKGHNVSVIEPSLDYCTIMEHIARTYDLQLNIYNCTAEHINMLHNKFDLIIFNSSLHHCDDPVLSLKNCYNLLDEKGKLLILNEPILPFFRTKTWFNNQLILQPEKMGHYGGNEHIYHYREYLGMMKSAGFHSVAPEFHIKNCSYPVLLESLKYDANKNPQRQAIKKTYFSLVIFLNKCGLLGSSVLEVMKRLSLLQMTFEATRE